MGSNRGCLQTCCLWHDAASGMGERRVSDSHGWAAGAAEGG